MNVIVYGSKRIPYISQPLRANGISVHEIYAWGGFIKRVKAAAQLWLLCRKYQHSYIIIDTPHWVGLTALVITCLFGKRYFLVLRGDMFSERHNPVLMKLNSIILEKAQGIAFLNEYLQECITARMPSLINYTVIPPPYFYLPQRYDHDHLNHDDLMLLTVTNFNYYDKISPLLLILDSVDKFIGSHPGVRWDICGSGRYLVDFQKKCATLKHRSSIRLLGHCENVDEHYNNASVFLYFTGLDVHPLVLDEAFLHKLPVVANRVLGLPTIVDDEKDGYLIDMNSAHWEEHLINKLSFLFDDRSAAIKMGVRGYEKTLIRQSPETIGKQIVDFIEQSTDGSTCLNGKSAD